jgi:hypothetical protein
MNGVPAGSPDDWRVAASTAVSLSEYLMTVALGVIAGQAALGSVLVERRTRLAAYYYVSVAALLLLVASTVFGGRGIAVLYHGGFYGQWMQYYWSYAEHDFNRQAVLLLSGFFVALASVVVALGRGVPKEPRGPDGAQRSCAI